jgi:hypothetical protein
MGRDHEKQAEDAKPWKRVDLDMIGPYEVKAANGNFTLRALTMILLPTVFDCIYDIHLDQRWSVGTAIPR